MIYFTGSAWAVPGKQNWIELIWTLEMHWESLTCLFSGSKKKSYFVLKKGSLGFLCVTHLDRREPLLCLVFDRPSAAFSQVTCSVLSLRLHHDLQFFPFTFLRILRRQYPTFESRHLWSIRAKKQRLLVKITFEFSEPLFR